MLLSSSGFNGRTCFIQGLLSKDILNDFHNSFVWSMSSCDLIAETFNDWSITSKFTSKTENLI